MRAHAGLYGLCLAVLSGLPACGQEDGDPVAEETSTTGTEASATDETSSTSGSDNELPTMEAVVNLASGCAIDGATGVSFVATRVGCLKPPPSPCTLPDPPTRYTGTVIDCPASEGDVTLQVGVPQTGRYHVETVLAHEDGTQVRECYVDGDTVEVIVDDGRLANRPTIEVSPLGHPCE
jgi:hypothetical protein